MTDGYIYKITSPSGRIYIGQTISLYKRISCYKNEACSGQQKIYRSIKKYGWENHKFEIIESVICLTKQQTIDYLNIQEEYYIALFKSISNGLNSRSGGLNNFVSDEVKILHSKFMTDNNPKYWSGKKRSQETLDAMSVSMYKKGAEPHNKGIKMSEEYNIEHRKRQIYLSGKAVICINTGIKFDSLGECSRKLNIDKSKIHRVITKKRRSTRGLKFEYANL